MWRRTYFLLLFVRLYFAIQPSYLHPDEAFQGPEIIASRLFLFPSHRTWEWTVAQPIRSVFPLWLFYGLPLTLLKWLWAKDLHKDVSPWLVYYSTRLIMCLSTFVLEDWAIHDLIQSPRLRRQAMVLVASSYVTWTFQSHTFSNSIETILVLWSLLLLDRIAYEQKRSAIGASIVLGFVLVLGTFNRITFPTFVMIPGIRLLPRIFYRPISVVALCLSGLFFTYIAVATDTAFFSGPIATESFRALFNYMRLAPVMTPLNNIRYNSQPSNLIEHGIHPHYQHFLVNLPQLLGPALPVLIFSSWPFNRKTVSGMFQNSRLTAAATGCIILSIIPHQEARFLLPCIPLLLTCLRIPQTPPWSHLFWTSWAIFNVAMAILMGVFHQGGVVPAQLAIPELVKTHTLQAHSAEVFWWKTYPAPTYLLGHQPVLGTDGKSINISTVTLMGMPQEKLVATIYATVDKKSPHCEASFLDFFSFGKKYSDTYVAAPLSAWRLDDLPSISNFSFGIDLMPSQAMQFTNIYTTRRHVNLDDMDFGDDGFVPTISRVVGRRGLGVWRVTKDCSPKGKSKGLTKDDAALSSKTQALPEISSNATTSLATSSGKASATPVAKVDDEISQNSTIEKDWTSGSRETNGTSLEPQSTEPATETPLSSSELLSITIPEAAAATPTTPSTDVHEPLPPVVSEPSEAEQDDLLVPSEQPADEASTIVPATAPQTADTSAMHEASGPSMDATSAEVPRETDTTTSTISLVRVDRPASAAQGSGSMNTEFSTAIDRKSLPLDSYTESSVPLSSSRSGAGARRRDEI